VGRVSLATGGSCSGGETVYIIKKKRIPKGTSAASYADLWDASSEPEAAESEWSTSACLDIGSKNDGGGTWQIGATITANANDCYVFIVVRKK
jgi:hypothetical protein